MTLLVIDIQKGITDERLYNFSAFINTVTRIIGTARKNGVEVVYVQHDDGPGSGFSAGDAEFEIAGQVQPQDGEKCYVKTINTCFGNKELAAYLEAKHEDCLMIVGLQTNFCIDASVKSAFERGYRVIIPAGANSTFDNYYMDGETTYRYYNDMMWPHRFADCLSLEDSLVLLQGASRA